MKEARAIDDAYDAGLDIKPLCGMAFVVKDNLDVLGYAFHSCSDRVVVTMHVLHLLCMVSAAAYVTAFLLHRYPTEAGTPALKGECFTRHELWSGS